MPLVHGGNRRAAALAWECDPGEVLDLSTGVPPEPDPADLARRLADLADRVSEYPDPDGEPGRTALASMLQVPKESIVLAAGAQAIIEVVFQAFGWKSLAVREPSFSEARRCAERSSVEVRATGFSEPWATAEACWVTDPDGYSGFPSEPPPNRVGVCDESYASLAARRCGVRRDWIRIGSLTKCFSMPGLRLGYAIATPEQIEQLRGWLPPWPASTLALHLLPQLLGDWPRREVRAQEQRERLCGILDAADWEAAKGGASFVLARPRGPLPDFAAHRILVREFPDWPQLHGWFRFGFPPNDSWSRLEEALCR